MTLCLVINDHRRLIRDACFYSTGAATTTPQDPTNILRFRLSQSPTYHDLDSGECWLGKPVWRRFMAVSVARPSEAKASMYQVRVNSRLGHKVCTLARKID